MKVSKGQHLSVKHNRKGSFNAIALEDFDTDTTTFYPVATADKVVGRRNEWEPGESIPCRNSLCVIEKIELN